VKRGVRQNKKGKLPYAPPHVGLPVGLRQPAYHRPRPSPEKGKIPCQVIFFCGNEGWVTKTPAKFIGRIIHYCRACRFLKKMLCLITEICMTQVTIPIADNILASLNMRTDEIARSMCREFALKSFQSGKLTLVQAAALCGMNNTTLSQLLPRRIFP
jgi:hypothetical protein